MKTLLDHRRPGVWVARDGVPLPDNLEQLTGLVIVFEANENFVSHRIYKAQVFILSPAQASFQKNVLAKVSFLKGDMVSSAPPSLISWGHAERQFLPGWMPIDEFQKKYCPLVISLGNRQSYMEIFERLSPDVGRQLLLAANEAAALNEFRPTSHLLHELRTSEHDLWSQLYREDEERFSLIAFSRLLNRRQAQTQSLSNVEAIQATVSLWGDNFELPLRLSFPTVLGERQLQNVIIGPNGSGKTNLLFGLAKCVLERRITIRDRDGVDQHSPWGLPIQVAVFTYEPSLWRRLRSKNIEIHRQGVLANNWRQLTQLVYDLGTQEESHIDLRLLVEILSGFIDVGALKFGLYPHAPSPSPRHWQQDRNEIEVSLAELAESPRLKFDDAILRLDRRQAPFMRTHDGHTYELSSGERSLVLFCTKLMKVAKKGALVLIDEPENHLHPKFITLMIQTLSRILLATESRALLVTHSPFVVREFERGTVKVLKLNGDSTPELFRPALQTLGGDVSMISDHVFEDEDITKGFELSIDRALRTRSFGDRGTDRKAWAEKLAEGLGEDAVSYLLAKSQVIAKGEG